MQDTENVNAPQFKGRNEKGKKNSNLGKTTRAEDALMDIYAKQPRS